MCPVVDDKACAATESLATTVAPIGLLSRVIRLTGMKGVPTETIAGFTTFIDFPSRVNSLMTLQMGAFLSQENPRMNWEHFAITEAFPTLSTGIQCLSFAGFLFCVSFNRITQG